MGVSPPTPDADQAAAVSAAVAHDRPYRATPAAAAAAAAPCPCPSTTAAHAASAASHEPPPLPTRGGGPAPAAASAVARLSAAHGADQQRLAARAAAPPAARHGAGGLQVATGRPAQEGQRRPLRQLPEKKQPQRRGGGGGGGGGLPSFHHAHREGTRGFRAPEVLLRKHEQGPPIDVWAAGVIVLSLATRRYPVFQASRALSRPPGRAAPPLSPLSI